MIRRRHRLTLRFSDSQWESFIALSQLESFRWRTRSSIVLLALEQLYLSRVRPPVPVSDGNGIPVSDKRSCQTPAGQIAETEDPWPKVMTRLLG
jgi:hypothetical protein